MNLRNWILFPAYAVLRMATAELSPIPGALPVDPLPILLALWMRDRDEPSIAALLFLPGLVAGDLMAGMSVWVLAGRCLMVSAFCLFPVKGGFHRRAWTGTFFYALGSAILVDLQGWAPLGFLTLAGVLQGFLWWGLLAPKAGGGPLHSFWGLLFPPAGFLAIHLLLPAPSFWLPPEVGTHSSNWIRAFSILVFLEPMLWRFLHARFAKDGEEGPGAALMTPGIDRSVLHD